MASPGRTSTPDVRPSREGDFIDHEVRITDSLAGISLKYGVPIDDIKKANKLYNTMIHGHVTLKIPFEKMRPSFDKQQERETEQRKLVRRFQTELRVPAEDARYYLGQVDFRYAEAIALFEQHSKEIDAQRQQGIPFHAVPSPSPSGSFSSTSTSASFTPHAMKGSRELGSVDKRTQQRFETLDSEFYNL